MEKLAITGSCFQNLNLVWCIVYQNHHERHSKQIGLIILLVFTGCDRIEYFPDAPINFQGTRIIAHQGGGAFDGGNTLAGSRYGLQHTDGIEVDIQRSADNTLWLSHDSRIGCHNFAETCFSLLHDNLIVAIDSCLRDSIDYTQLESIFSFMATNYPNSFLSLDVKAWHPCSISEINVIRQMNQMADAIIELTGKYQMQGRVMVESEVGDFLYYMKSNSKDIDTYLVSLGDLELGISRALDAGFSGISFHFKFDEPVTKDLVDLIHRKGLKVQLWTIKNPADFEDAKSVNPDFIQTDYF